MTQWGIKDSGSTALNPHMLNYGLTSFPSPSLPPFTAADAVSLQQMWEPDSGSHLIKIPSGGHHVWQWLNHIAAYSTSPHRLQWASIQHLLNTPVVTHRKLFYWIMSWVKVCLLQSPIVSVSANCQIFFPLWTFNYLKTGAISFSVGDVLEYKCLRLWSQTDLGFQFWLC